ncbi:MAG: protease HtpX [Simkaniaceae bacterium]|nr:protease HtpX [Simkaniaceae bacterium]
MKIAKRIFLFLLVNALVIFTLSLVLNFLGVKPYLTHYGLDYQALFTFCLVWGMGGSLISLMLSKKMAKWMMGVQILARHDNPDLYDMVERLSRHAGLKAMPEVGLFHSAIPNAFATGPSERSALVAVSTGLMQRMNPRELEAVVAHEISHIANGDMVTLTLLQGIVNVFVMFLARVLAYAIGNSRDRRGGSNFMLVFVFEILFMILGSMVVCKFSRWREFRADAGGAMLAGKESMISALEKLSAPQEGSKSMNALMISGPRAMRLFATHPPLKERIRRLRES